MTDEVEKFEDVFKKAYGWTFDDKYSLHGLVAGDMGYESTDMTLGKLVELAYEKAQDAEDYHKHHWAIDFLIADFICKIAEKAGYLSC